MPTPMPTPTPAPPPPPTTWPPQSTRTHARRAALAALATLTLAPLVACAENDAPATSSTSTITDGSTAAGEPQTQRLPYAEEFEALERKYDARLGVYAIDTGTGREVAYNDSERFLFASTFKALAAGAVLRKHTLDGMDQVITYSKDEVVVNSPVTEKHVKTGMTLKALCDAAVRFSDNTAANLLFEQLGGPEGLQAVLEELGDDMTRMERIEPGLSDWSPDSTRDTSTPGRWPRTCARSSSETSLPSPSGRSSPRGCGPTPPATRPSGPVSPGSGWSATRPEAATTTASATTSPWCGRPTAPLSSWRS